VTQLCANSEPDDFQLAGETVRRQEVAMLCGGVKLRPPSQIQADNTHSRFATIHLFGENEKRIAMDRSGYRSPVQLLVRRILGRIHRLRDPSQPGMGHSDMTSLAAFAGRDVPAGNCTWKQKPADLINHMVSTA
jgi:hypothetical protein